MSRQPVSQSVNPFNNSARSRSIVRSFVGSGENYPGLHYLSVLAQPPSHCDRPTDAADRVRNGSDDADDATVGASRLLGVGGAGGADAGGKGPFLSLPNANAAGHL